MSYIQLHSTWLLTFVHVMFLFHQLIPMHVCSGTVKYMGSINVPVEYKCVIFCWKEKYILHRIVENNKLTKT